MTWQMENFVQKVIRTNFNSHCPDCEITTDSRGSLVAYQCGRDKDEHTRYLELIEEAEQEAQKVVREIQERNLMPLAIIKAAYDGAERRVKGY